jgi:hypothetical protein
MPIYEFYCPDNNKLYSFFARTFAEGAKTPRCPDNPKFKMERAVSQFAVTGRAKEKADMPGGTPDVDDPRMEAAMAEMEREFSGTDDENPDPRAIARMMRKMSALTGEKIPAPMEEMMGRMEAGEDPEQLEAEYGDALKDFEGGEGSECAGDEASERRKRLRAHLRSLGKRPVRDPQLYEMGEFV